MPLEQVNNLYLAPQIKKLPEFIGLNNLPLNSIINAEIILDPNTKQLALKFNGEIYSANLPTDMKTGQIIKAIIKSNTDQIILKLLDEVLESKTNNLSKEKITKSEIQASKLDLVISKSELKLLREIISQSYSKTELQADSKKIPSQITQKIPHQIGINEASQLQKQVNTIIEKQVLNLKSNIEFNKNLIGQNLSKISNLQNLDIVSQQELSKIQENPQLTKKLTLTQILNENLFRNLEVTHTTINEIREVLQDILIVSKIDSSENALVKSLVENSANQLVVSLKQIVNTKINEKSEIFDLIKNIILSKLDKVMLEYPSEQSNFFNINYKPKYISLNLDNISTNIKTDTTVDKDSKTIAVKKSLLNSQIEVFTKSIAVKNFICESLNSFYQANDSIKKIFLADKVDSKNFYGLIPIYLNGNIVKAETLLEFSKEESKNSKRNKPKIIRIKVSLPLLGDITAEILVSGDYLQMNLYVDSEKSKLYLDENLDIINSNLIQQNLFAKSINVIVRKSSSIMPLWLTKELGISERA